jgi:hypothetical protein
MSFVRGARGKFYARLLLHIPGGFEENNEKPLSTQPVILLRSKMWISRVEVESVQVLTAASMKMTVLMMEAWSTSETSANFYQTTRRNIPEDIF